MKVAHTEIFLLPAGQLIGADSDDFFILYAPLSQDICFMEKKDAQAIKNHLEHSKISTEKELMEFANNLANTSHTPTAIPPMACQSTRMSLLPNYMCNFSCSYCYSAKGRSKQAVNWEKVKATLNYFIDKNRIEPSQTLSLFISGGGEPLLSWDVVSLAIDYARERANSQGFNLRISLITNGSLLTETKVKWLKTRECSVCVSFEVLEDLQNNQRGQHERVSHSLQLLGEAGVTTMINATITPASVERMVEMTSNVVSCYPFVKQFTMEPVTSVSLFSSPLDMRHFYDIFIDKYSQAKQLANLHGLHLRFAMDEALESLVVRHCPGKFCLTAEGTISACHLATSPKEERYEKCIYGRVSDDGNVEINEEKFQLLYKENMLAKHRCNECFARWNCGGECMARNDIYPQEYMEEVCRFNRKWLMHLLKEKLEKETIKSQGLTLREVALQSEIETLREKDIYVLPANQKQWLLYAPLADCAGLFSYNDVLRLGRTAALLKKTGHDNNNQPEIDEEAQELLNDITNVVPVAKRNGYVRSVRDFINLSILPNNVCNFSCSYCYSAQGRSRLRISYTQVKSAVDFFLSPERNQSNLLTVSIFGGGEPLLSWNDVVKPLLSYLQIKANEQQRRIITTLITNGSLLPEDFISICLSNNIDLVISYEVLRDVQDCQRLHYDLVTGNIRKMIEKGVIPAINTVVTPFNVNRIDETVEQLHTMFPEIKYLSVEPVKDLHLPNRRDFYGQFVTQFMQAREKAKHYGIILSCSASRKVDQTIERYCAGEMALCADGSLSICPCVSSPSEPFFDSYVYGHIAEDGSLTMDEQKLAGLLCINVNTHPWCKKCFARWNCSGGCMHSNNKNGNKQDSDFCWFTREMTKRLILQRLIQKES